jgi:glycosyltransferase involved in cell wall biosynthesis
MTRPDAATPAVSALVCTRNRSDSLVRTVRSLLQSPGPFEVLVIDQSDDDAAQAALAAMSDPRLRYVRSRIRGKGAALNQGLRLAAGNVVVCTDDDCEAPAGWVMAMAAVTAQQPRAAVVFCNVLASPHDRMAGYVPAYERRDDRVLSSLLEARTGLGLGAGMALRRQAVLEFGGFDEAFGPGSRFGSADDWDISLRALLSGWQVYDSADLAVLHHGFRTLAEGKQHALRDWIAIGALCAKPVRAGYISAIGLAGWLFVAKALWPPVRDVLSLRKPRGLARITGFVSGFSGGISTPVDPKTLLFRNAK